MFVKRRDVLLVAREAVEGLRDDDVEVARSRILKQFLIARAQADRSAYSVIGIARDKGPTFLLDPSSARSDLILDRRVMLERGTVAGVNDGADQGSSSLSRLSSIMPLRMPMTSS